MKSAVDGKTFLRMNINRVAVTAHTGHGENLLWSFKVLCIALIEMDAEFRFAIIFKLL